MSCFNKCTECNILAPAFILLFTLVISLLSTASFVAALDTNLIKGSNIGASSHTATLLDPNPQLIDKDSNLIQYFNVSINDPENSSVSFSTAVIRLYHPPVVLVHGL